MTRRSVRRLIDAAEFLSEEFTAPDHPDPAVVHNVPYLLDPFPGRPPKVRPSKAGEVICSPSVKYCTHCGEGATREEEDHGTWAKRRKCGRCQAKPRPRGERQSVLYCMHCRTQFERPAGLSTRALCDDCQRQSDERKGTRR